MIQVFRPIPVEKIKLLVFDLDGTLIDSAQDLCNSVNEALKEFKHEPLPDPAIASFVGNGAPMLMRRSLALASNMPPEEVDEELFNKAYAFFLQYYREHKLDFTYAYEGVLEALKALAELHDQAASPARAMAVLTNKPVRASREICAALGLDRFFFQIYGGNSFHTKKPDPVGLLKLMEEASALLGGGVAGVLAEATVMVGDSDVDVLTARNCGAHSIGCSFGLAPERLAAAGAELVVSSPREWPKALRELAAGELPSLYPM